MLAANTKFRMRVDSLEAVAEDVHIVLTEGRNDIHGNDDLIIGSTQMLEGMLPNKLQCTLFLSIIHLRSTESVGRVHLDEQKSVRGWGKRGEGGGKQRIYSLGGVRAEAALTRLGKQKKIYFLYLFLFSLLSNDYFP